MTLVHELLLIGNENYLDSVPCSNLTELHWPYLYLKNMNSFFNKQSKMSVESVCNINVVLENTFSKYKDLIDNKYDLESGRCYGYGSYYHLIPGGKFSFVSQESVLANHDSFLIISHPAKKLLPIFSDNFNYDNSGLVCDFSDFDYQPYFIGLNEVESFKTNLIAILGHVHINENDALGLNFGEEIYLNHNSVGINPISLSDQVEHFRNYNDAQIKNEDKCDFKYSNILIRKGKKYYLYSEATAIGVNYNKNIRVEKEGMTFFENNEFFHHDRLGFLMELSPSKKGASNSKISLVSYMESLNALLRFKSQKDDFDSKAFISEISRNLESVL